MIVTVIRVCEKLCKSVRTRCKFVKSPNSARHLIDFVIDPRPSDAPVASFLTVHVHLCGPNDVLPLEMKSYSTGGRSLNSWEQMKVFLQVVSHCQSSL
jgi:hypothetical protein